LFGIGSRSPHPRHVLQDSASLRDAHGSHRELYCTRCKLMPLHSRLAAKTLTNSVEITPTASVRRSRR